MAAKRKPTIAKLSSQSKGDAPKRIPYRVKPSKYRSAANAVARSTRRGQGESTMGDGKGMSFGDSADYIYGREERQEPFRSSLPVKKKIPSLPTPPPRKKSVKKITDPRALGMVKRKRK